MPPTHRLRCHRVSVGQLRRGTMRGRNDRQRNRMRQHDPSSFSRASSQPFQRRRQPLKTLRQAPMRLDHGPHLRRHLSDFAYDSRKEGLTPAAGQARDALRHASCAAGQPRQSESHHAHARQPGSAPRQRDPAAQHARLLGRWTQPFSSRQRIHQNQPGHFIRIPDGVHADEQSTERMANQHIGPRNTSGAKQRVKLFNQPRHQSRRIRRVAPSQPSAIIRAG